MQAPESNAALLTHAIAHCRAGFERETARDLTKLAQAARSDIAIEVVNESALVAGHITGGGAMTLAQWSQAQVRAPAIFARSIAIGAGPCRLFDARPSKGTPDRIGPLMAHANDLRSFGPFSALWIEYPDTNDGKALSPLARSLEPRLADALRKDGLLEPQLTARPRLHIVLVDGATAWLALSDPGSGSPWPLGIPRLHMPGRAPSRSTLKLAEALGTFLGARETELLRAGMNAVDLGAAPGGWTWQLVQRGVRVIAVDNGDLRGPIADDPLVTHVRDDGLRFRPRRPVDWLVCDIVEQPVKIAHLVARWIADGDARHAIFNLKLPMKKRYEEVQRCTALIEEVLGQRGRRCALRIRQLYHDREEVTGYLTSWPHKAQARSIAPR